ncbi:MAG: hypothetical protein IJB36_06735 [Clostridia bacterium]|nr:hypothetical protein [Clostridia bacterium]
MSFCQSCGANVGESVFCPHCGYSINGQPPAYAQPPVQYIIKPMTPDAPSKGIAWLSFFFPLVGLILYLVYHDTKPKKAASAGKGALWGFFGPLIVVIVFVLVLTLITAVLFSRVQAVTRSEKYASPAPHEYSISTTAEFNIPDIRPEI